MTQNDLSERSRRKPRGEPGDAHLSSVPEANQANDPQVLVNERDHAQDSEEGEAAADQAPEDSSALHEAVNAIKRAEAAIRALKTAKDGDLESDARLDELADRLSVLALNSQSKPRLQSPEARSRYPFFYISLGQLVRVKWSKSRNREYEHHASQQEAEAFTAYLGTVTAPRDPFRFIDQLPAHDEDGRELPRYVVYMILGWLLQAGVIEKLDRSLYRRVVDPLDAHAFAVLWENTRQR